MSFIREAETVEKLFKVALDRTVGHEGGFSNHPNDSGGATRFGITEALAREYGYAGDMRAYPWIQAERVYRVHFWQHLACDRICLLSGPIANEVFDTAVNCGRETAGAWLQRILNVLNRQQGDYKDLVVDGKPGSVTVATLSAFLRLRDGDGELVMLRLLNALQGAHYVTLAERKATQEDFLFGWAKNRVAIA